MTRASLHRKLFGIIFLLPLLARSVFSSSYEDVLALVAFKEGINDQKNLHLTSWNVDDSTPCKWNGVECDNATQRVSELVLDGFSLSGQINRALLQLRYLRRLSLSRNNLSGTLNPKLVASLGNLEIIDLSGNNLSGVIPDEFFQHCGALKSVSLANNAFSGVVPQSLSSCSTLEMLNLSSNRLSDRLPPELWSLNALRMLDLSDNMLDGGIPEGIEKLSNLKIINLRRNMLKGRIPDGIGNCFSLTSVDLSENYLSGVLPESLGKLFNCSFLHLRSNVLSGELPSWIGEIENLEYLDLSSNQFSGRIPESLGKLLSLKMLNLSMNGLNGSLPDSLNGCRSLLNVDFSKNSLTGKLPFRFFEMSLLSISLSGNYLNGPVEIPSSSAKYSSFWSLELLDLSSNNLSGEIPQNIGSFRNLHFLNLSFNSFSGQIPVGVGKLKALGVLDLRKNYLNGSIPSAIGEAAVLKEKKLENKFLGRGTMPQICNCSALTVLVLASNLLHGSLPETIANLLNLQILDVSFNNLTGSLPKNLSNLAHLSIFNISYNNFQGGLPTGGFFNKISAYSLLGNPYLCSSAVNSSCTAVLPKPIVLNPNSSSNASSSGPFTTNLRHKKIILSISALIAIGAAAFITLGVITVTVLNLHVRSAASRSAAAIALSNGDDDFSHSPATDANSGKLVMFSGNPDFSTSTHALLNKDCELGRGGFGAVYRSFLRDGRPVAIKKLTVSSLVKSQDDFEREVKKLGKVRHCNLVALEGYYWTPSLQLLIYEYVPGGSLYKHLHESSAVNTLSWKERFNVILGTAKSLAHLHQLNIIHYNMKSSNILLDSSGEPKVGDFGLVKLLPMLDRYVLSSKIQSALGYMAPEFACKTVKITEKCDVYGFGVLALEVVTGRRPVEYMEDDVVVLCDMVRGALEEGRVEGCMDEKLQGKFPVEEAIPVMKLCLICTCQVPSNRPDMGEVVNILELIRCPSEGQAELN